MIEDGGGHLLQVARGTKKVLIPFVKSYVRRVDVDSGEIELELPPGLLKACESTF